MSHLHECPWPSQPPLIAMGPIRTIPVFGKRKGKHTDGAARWSHSSSGQSWVWGWQGVCGDHRAPPSLHGAGASEWWATCPQWHSSMDAPSSGHLHALSPLPIKMPPLPCSRGMLKNHFPKRPCPSEKPLPHGSSLILQFLPVRFFSQPYDSLTGYY